MPLESRKPAELRDSWRPVETDGRRSRRLRLLGRLVVTAILFGLVFVWWRALVEPLEHPKTPVVSVAAASYDEPQSLQRRYARGSAVAVSLRDAKAGPDASPPAADLFELRTPDDLAALAKRLEDARLLATDAVVVYLQAEGLAVNDKAYLLCEEFSATNPEAGRIEMRQLLDALDRSGAGTKLLLLDPGGRDYDPRLGTIVSEFLPLARTAVESSGDGGLYVITAYGTLERSHVLHARRQTIFGHFAARGMAGEADENGDRSLDVGELFRYLETNVAVWADEATAGYSHQTPQLIFGTAEAESRSTFPTVLPVAGNLLADIQALADLAAAPTATPSATGTAPTAPVPSATPTSTKPAAAPKPTPTGTARNVAAAPASTGADPATAAASAIPPALQRARLSETELALSSAVAAASRVAPVAAPSVPAPPGPEVTVEKLVLLNRDLLAAGEAGPPLLQPLTFAPHLWTAIKMQARGYELRLTERPDLRKQIEPNLRRFSTALAEFVAGRAPSANLPLLKQAAALRSPPPLDEGLLGTWALVERYHAEGGSVADEEFVAWVAALDAAFTADDRAKLDALAKPWPERAARYVEFAGAAELSAQVGVPWPLLRAGYWSLRQSERVAALPEAARPQFAGRITAADRRRAGGLHRLFDQTGAEWAKSVEADLATAFEAYRSIEDDCLALRRAEEFYHGVLADRRSYLGWFYSGAGDPACSPTAGSLDRLFTAAADLGTLLRAADYEPRRLAEASQRVELAVQDVRRPLDSAALETLTSVDVLLPARRRRLEVVRRSGLLTPAQITQVERAAAEVDAAATPPARVPNRSEHELPRSQAVTLRLAQDLLHLGDLSARLYDENHHVAAAAAQPKVAEPTAATPVAEFDPIAFWKSARRQGRAAGEALASLSSRIDETVRAATPLDDLKSRSERLAALNKADEMLRSLDPRDVGKLALVPPCRVLREAHWYDSLRLARDRLLRRRNDASPLVIAFLTEAADRLTRAARTISGQPAIGPPSAEVVVMSGPANVQPAEDSLQSYSLEVSRVASGSGNKIWLTVEYDAGLVELILPPQLQIYDTARLAAELARRSSDAAVALDQLQAASLQASADKRDDKPLEAARDKAEQARIAAEYPYDPQLGELPPNIELNVGESQTVTFQIRRRANSAGRTKVIFRAISGHSFVRHDIRVALPALDQIALVVADGGGAWTATSDGLTLHPRPNRTTNYEFQLLNQGGVERTVDVEFVAPAVRPEASLPAGLRTLQTSEVLALVGAATSLVKIDELKLPADGRPVTLAAPRPKEPANAGLTPEDRNRAETTVGKTTTDDKQPAVSIRHGMLVIVRRRDTGETMVRRLDFRPERPRRYVRPRVGYNAATERIEINVTPIDRSTVPTEGIDVRCEFPEPLARGTVAKLQGTITAPDYNAGLFIEAPLSESRVQRVYLTVDGYPRAFVYDVPCTRASTDLPEAGDLLEAVILSPTDAAMLKAPLDQVSMRMEVNAPPGSFESDQDVLEVGVDRNRDRDFSGETILRLTTDRQADISLVNFGQNGVVTVKTDVHDFELGAPSGGLQNVRVNLAARMQVGPRVVWSVPVEIGLDSAGPQITRVELRPGRTVAAGTDLEVEVWSVDGEMSGTAIVEAAFDVAATGMFSEAAPPVKGEKKTPPSWTAKVPTKPLQPGPAVLLVRATDAVGNVGPITRVPIDVVNPAELAAQAALGGRVIGTIRYGGQPLAAAEVTVRDAKQKEVGRAKADDKGIFAVEGIPPGNYVLTARGLARNRPRTAEQTVVVPPPPQKSQRLEIDVK
jgi:hypothetical protein